MRTSITLLALVALLPVAVGEEEPRAAAATSRVDLRPEFERLGLPWKGQGRRNTCSVFTTVGAIGFAVSKRLGESRPASEEFLNWAANQVVGNRTDDRGQFFHHLLEGFRRHGVCAEAEMPYAATFHPEYEPSVRAIESAKRTRDLGLRPRWIRENDGTKGITQAHLEEIKATLRRGWPVCGGSFHSVLFVGYEDDPALDGGGQLLVRDSANPGAPPMSYAEALGRLCDVVVYEIDLPPAQPPRPPPDASGE
jgi:hypothetical protein